MSFSQLSFKFSRILLQTISVFTITAIIFLFYVINSHNVNRANNLRLHAVDLSNELLFSSQNMIHMAKSYVVTGDTVYKNHYIEMDNIRDGKKPRYQHYYEMQTFIDRQKGVISNIENTQNISLMSIIKKLDLTKDELAKLTKAKIHADRLKSIDLKAMKLSQEGHKEKATKLLYSKTYKQLEDSIMHAILGFNAMLNKRMDKQVKKDETIDLYLQFFLFLLGIISLFMLWRIYKILEEILGGTVDDLHQHIINIGKGDFSQPINVSKKYTDSVLHWLAQTKMNLKDLTTANKRLKKFYEALSQCNQAMVHAKDKTELFDLICKAIVNYAEMRTAWIGIIDETNATIKPISVYGSASDYIKTLVLSYDPDSRDSKGTTAQAIITKEPSWCQDYLADPNISQWHDKARVYGFGSAASLPIKLGGKVIGVLAIYAKDKNIFDAQIKSLLEEMVMNVNYSLDKFESDTLHAEAEDEILESHNLLTSIINVSPIRIFWKDKDLKYLGCNTLVAQDAGVSEASDLIGKDDTQLWWKDRAEKNHNDDIEVLNTGIPKLFYEELKTTKENKSIWIRKSKVPLRNKDQEIIGILGMYEDITKQKKEEENNRYLANNDVLTGLPNRANFDVQTKFALKLAERNHENAVIMFLGLDRFKYINDTLGHNTGDLILIETAKRFKSVLREVDTIARFGGDEFVVLLPNIQIDHINLVAQKLLGIMKKPFILQENELNISVSIGIAIYPDDGLESATLYKNADIAMHYAKQNGRNNYHFFTQKLQENSTKNLRLSNALSHAIEKDQLELYFQPQIDTKSKKIIGAEALLRWHYGDQGMIPPSEFIPLAENNGLMLPIGDWVLSTAIKQAKQWIDEGFEPIIMAVNISAVQFRQKDLAGKITRMLQEIGLPPKYLELELTEGVAMNNPQQAISIMNELYKKGIRMSIDDFGTGYSSLSYLKKFKTYKLKVDQSFVRDINTDLDDKAIVVAIIKMAKSIGLITIAEGVETIEQLEFLRDEGCDQIQGYYYSRPLSALEFQEFRVTHKINQGIG